MLLYVLCFAVLAVDLDSYSDGNVCVEASFLPSEQLYFEVIVDVENTHVRVECFEGRYRFGSVCTCGSISVSLVRRVCLFSMASSTLGRSFFLLSLGCDTFLLHVSLIF